MTRVWSPAESVMGTSSTPPAKSAAVTSWYTHWWSRTTACAALACVPPAPSLSEISAPPSTLCQAETISAALSVVICASSVLSAESRSAATPQVSGLAEDVPPKQLWMPEPPGPVVVTQSPGLATSGFSWPSIGFQYDD